MFSLFHPGGITWSMFSRLWYGHWGTVECEVVLVKVLLAFEWARDKTTARWFLSWKCPCQGFKAWHSHLAPGTAQASSHPKLAREIWVLEEFYCEEVCVETKPLKCCQKVQGEVFLDPRYRKRRRGQAEGRERTPKPSWQQRPCYLLEYHPGM